MIDYKDKWAEQNDSLKSIARSLENEFGKNIILEQHALQVVYEQRIGTVKYYCWHDEFSAFTLKGVIKRNLELDIHPININELHIVLMLDRSSKKRSDRMEKQGMMITSIPSPYSFKYILAGDSEFEGIIICLSKANLETLITIYLKSHSSEELIGKYLSHDKIHSMPLPFEIAFECKNLLGNIFENHGNRNPVYFKGCIYKILASYITNLIHPPLSRPNNSDVDRLVDLVKRIKSNIHSTLPTIQEAATQTNMSTTKFKSIFKRLYRYPYFKYFFHYRMEKAKQLLTTGVPITEISQRVGYSSINAFSTSFKAEFGIKPSQYWILYPQKSPIE